MGFGFVVARFGIFLREIAAAGNLAHPPHTAFSLWIGTALVLLGVAVSLLAAWEHSRFLRRLTSGAPYSPPRLPLSIIVAVLLSVLGVLMSIYLVALR
jgi:putative membrane protein